MRPGPEERANGFLEAHRVFSRAEFAESIDSADGPRASQGLLRSLADDGRIRESAPGVYVVAWDRESRGRFVVPDYLLASRLRPDGVLGYHTALELHGTDYALLYHAVHLVSDGPAGHVDLPFQRCRFIRPHRALVEAGRTDFLTETRTLMGVPVRMTAWERTLVDTALNAFHAPLPRLSVDIDINYVGKLGRARMHDDKRRFEDRLVGIMASRGYRHVYAPPGGHGKWRFGYPDIAGRDSALLIDLNYRERMPLLRRLYRSFTAADIRRIRGGRGAVLRSRRPGAGSTTRSRGRSAPSARPGRAERVARWRVHLHPDVLDPSFQGVHPDGCPPLP